MVDVRVTVSQSVAGHGSERAADGGAAPGVGRDLRQRRVVSGTKSDRGARSSSG